MNSDVIRSTYWAAANLPKPVLEGYGTIDEFHLKYRFGLRLVVQLCDGNRCNGEGDDFVEPEESSRLQSCYDVDDDNGQDLCLLCRTAGLVAGSLVIVALFLTVILLGAVIARCISDNIITKCTTIGVAGGGWVLSFVALAVYGGQCYQKLIDDQFKDDDFVDKDDVNYFLGPGYFTLIVAMVLHAILIVLLFFVPIERDSTAEIQEVPWL